MQKSAKSMGVSYKVVLYAKHAFRLHTVTNSNLRLHNILSAQPQSTVGKINCKPGWCRPISEKDAAICCGDMLRRTCWPHEYAAIGRRKFVYNRNRDFQNLVPGSGIRSGFIWKFNLLFFLSSST